MPPTNSQKAAIEQFKAFTGANDRTASSVSYLVAEMSVHAVHHDRRVGQFLTDDFLCPVHETLWLLR